MLWIVFQIVYTVLAFAIGLKLVLDNRNPLKAMAWLLVLAFLPFVGLLLYFFFGRIGRRSRIISGRALSTLSRKMMTGFVAQPLVSFPPKYAMMGKFFKRSANALPFEGNDIDVFIDGKSMIDALIAELEKAQHHIHMQFYIFENDEVGRCVRDVLVEKAKAGVDVRLIYDDVGCWHVANSFFRKMRREGIDARSFLNVYFPRFTGRVNYRNHRKIVVVDGKVGFLGGMNIANRYVDGGRFDHWRDTHMVVRGRAVYALQRSFVTDWYFVTQKMIDQPEFYPKWESVPGNTNMQIVTSDPIRHQHYIMQGYLMAIGNAERYIYIETPYFLPTEPLLVALRTAAMSGIDVRLMIPLHSDSILPHWGTRSYIEEMLEAGVKVYHYKVGFLHSKLFVSDDQIVSIGSANMDFRSFENNFEINAFVYNVHLAQRMRSLFRDDMKRCVMLTLDGWRKRSLLVRLCESFVRLLSPLL